MKDFQKFVDSLDQDFIDTLSEDTTYVLNAKVPLTNTLLSGNFAVAMRILERYHEWLHSENDEDIQ